MNHNFKNGADLFKAIIKNPKILTTLPDEYRYDVDFLEPFYIILNNEIKPYIPKEVFNILKHHEIIIKNQNPPQPTFKPNITLKNELEILHDILTDPKTIESLPTDEKYNNSFLEFIYIIWGDQIKPYIPFEIFEQLENEALMKKYHQDYRQKQKNWEEEENKKVLTKNKNCYQ